MGGETSPQYSCNSKMNVQEIQESRRQYKCKNNLAFSSTGSSHEAYWGELNKAQIASSSKLEVGEEKEELRLAAAALLL